MSSPKKQQLAVCKAALEAVQAEIKGAKDKVIARESQLEKAIQEGKPNSILASFKSLYDGSTALLTGLQNEKTGLIKQISQLTLSLTAIDDEIEEIPLNSDGSPNRRRIDALIEKSKKYLFQTDKWACVTVIKKRRAVTFAHKEHRDLQPGMVIKIYSVEGNVPYDVKVVKTDAESDWVLLEAEVDLCEEEPKIGLTVDGREYVQLGLSAIAQHVSPLSISKGVISSSRLNKFGHLLGSAGANPGDSGGPCFDVSTGELIGINVGCENIPINLEKDTGAQIYDKISSRYASRAHIIPSAISYMF